MFDQVMYQCFVDIWVVVLWCYCQVLEVVVVFWIVKGVLVVQVYDVVDYCIVVFVFGQLVGGFIFVVGGEFGWIDWQYVVGLVQVVDGLLVGIDRVS